MFRGGFMSQSLCGAILHWNINIKNLQQNAWPNLKGKKQLVPVTHRDGSDGWEKLKNIKQLLSRSYLARKWRSEETLFLCSDSEQHFAVHRISHTVLMVMVWYKNWPIYFQKVFPARLFKSCLRYQISCWPVLHPKPVSRKVLVSFWFYIGIS